MDWEWPTGYCQEGAGKNYELGICRASRTQAGGYPGHFKPGDRSTKIYHNARAGDNTG